MAVPVKITAAWSTYGIPFLNSGPFISSSGAVYVFSGFTYQTPYNYYIHKAATRGGAFTVDVANFNAAGYSAQFCPRVVQNGDVLHIVYGVRSNPTWTWYYRTFDMSTDTLSATTTLGAHDYIDQYEYDHQCGAVVRDVAGTKQLVIALPSGFESKKGNKYSRIQLFFKDLPSGSMSSPLDVNHNGVEEHHNYPILSSQGDEDEIYCFIDAYAASLASYIAPVYSDNTIGTCVADDGMNLGDFYTNGVVEGSAVYFYASQDNIWELQWNISGTGSSRTVTRVPGFVQTFGASGRMRLTEMVYNSTLGGRIGFVGTEDEPTYKDSTYVVDHTSGSWVGTLYDSRALTTEEDYSSNLYEVGPEIFIAHAQLWLNPSKGESPPPDGYGIYYDEIGVSGGTDHEVTGDITQAGHVTAGLLNVYIPADHELAGSLTSQFLTTGLLSVNTIKQITGAVTGGFVTLGYGGPPGGTEEAVQHERSAYRFVVDGVDIGLLQAVIKRGRNYNLFNGWVPADRSSVFNAGAAVSFEKNTLDIHSGEITDSTALFSGQVNYWHRKAGGKVLVECSGIAAFPALVSRHVEGASYIRNSGEAVTVRARMDTRFNPGDFMLYRDINLQVDDIVYYINPTNSWMELGHG